MNTLVIPAARSRHDHRLAALYHVAAVLVISFYGIRVCPFVAGLNPWTVLASFGLGFGLSFLVKLMFENRLLPEGEPFTLSVWQFFIDLTLFTLVGVGIMVWNHLHHAFPLESGLKVLVGCIMFGLFAGLDNGLRRERLTPAVVNATIPPTRIYPITSRLILIFTSIAIFSGLVLALVIVKDVDYLIAHLDDYPPGFLRRAVFIDIAFIVSVVLLLAIRLLFAYGRNLRQMLNLQITGLDAVTAGRLDRMVPVLTRDEFSLIATKTNQMILTLRRAQREQQELFEVSLALVRELRLDSLLARIVATTRDFVGADRVSLFLHDPLRGELWGKVAEGVDSPLRFPEDQGIAGHVFQTGETVICTDPYRDPRFNPEVDRRSGYQTRSLLCLPISDREGRRIGVIQALNRVEGEFTESDAARLGAFAAQAAIALVNAQLFADLDRARRYSESILQSLSNGVVTLDPQGRVVKLNQAASALLGVGPELVGQDFDRALGPQRDWWRGLRQVGDRAYLPDTEIELADGRRRSANITRTPLSNLEQQTLGALLVFDDLTESKRVRDTLSRYLPGPVAEQVLADADNRLGGADLRATVLFSDIRDFTTISEQIGARATVTMLNEYFSSMVEAISERGGILDKYIGDAIMAVFGVPYPGEDDADRALGAAMEMLSRLKELNRLRQQRGQPPLGMGIGLSTGELIAGNIGAPRRMDYTVIGDTVNLAARLESATKTYGATLLISEQTRAALRQPPPMRELDCLRVKGKTQAVRIHQVFGPDEQPPAAALERFQIGRERLMRADWQGAREAFRSARGHRSDDVAIDLFLQRCDQLQAQPPPDDWDGGWPVR